MKRIIVAALAVVALALPLAQAAPVQASAFSGVFFVNCKFSNTKQVDPIVAPGSPLSSHLHTFMGNTGITENTTADNIKLSGTTCADKLDISGYWQPSLIAPDGSVVLPADMNAYYRKNNGDVGTFIAFPAGLKALSGGFSYNCGTGTPFTTTPYDCTPYGPKAYLRLGTRFASCWDGVNLDSADHKSHLAFPKRGICPATHPVQLPRLTFHIRYPSVIDPTLYTLSSGALSTLHGDFFNGWDQDRLQHLVDACLNASVACGRAEKVA